MAKLRALFAQVRFQRTQGKRPRTLNVLEGEVAANEGKASYVGSLVGYALTAGLPLRKRFGARRPCLEDYAAFLAARGFGDAASSPP